jgi:hypothetical protein
MLHPFIKVQLMLYVVMLGGSHPRAKIEVHDIVFAAADSLEATFAQLREQWFGNAKGLHIDSWMAVDGVERWRVEMSPLAPKPESNRLFFINLGGYVSHVFGEAHHYILVVAQDAREAKSKGRSHMLKQWKGAHTDGVLDIDDCLPIDQVGGRFVHLVEAEHEGVTVKNDYIVLSR